MSGIIPPIGYFVIFNICNFAYFYYFRSQITDNETADKIAFLVTIIWAFVTWRLNFFPLDGTKCNDAVFLRTYPLLYHTFENMVIFRSGKLIFMKLHFVAQKTRISRKLFSFNLFISKARNRPC